MAKCQALKSKLAKALKGKHSKKKMKRAGKILAKYRMCKKGH